jgi:hypothetical protein
VFELDWELLLLWLVGVPIAGRVELSSTQVHGGTRRVTGCRKLRVVDYCYTSITRWSTRLGRIHQCRIGYLGEYVWLGPGSYRRYS